MPPVTRSSGASGPRKSSRLIRTRAWTPWLQVSSSIATQSQLEVCGAPTRIPVRGTSPTVRQRASRRTVRAKALRSMWFLGSMRWSSRATPTLRGRSGTPVSRGTSAPPTPRAARHRRRTRRRRARGRLLRRAVCCPPRPTGSQQPHQRPPPASAAGRARRTPAAQPGRDGRRRVVGPRQVRHQDPCHEDQVSYGDVRRAAAGQPRTRRPRRSTLRGSDLPPRSRPARPRHLPR